MPGTHSAPFISHVLISIHRFSMDLCGASSLPAVRQAILVECYDEETIRVHRLKQQCMGESSSAIHS